MTVRRLLRSRAAPAAAFAVAAALPALAEDGRLEMTTERVVVFKDGTCLVVKRATGTSDASGALFTEDVPDAAVLGTFWAVPEDGRMLSMTAAVRETTEETTESAPCTDWFAVIRANVGRAVTLELDGGTTLQGTVRGALGAEVRRDADRAAAPWRSALAIGPAARTTADVSGDLVALTTAEGDVLVSASRIRRLTAKDAALAAERKVTERRLAKRLTFRFEGGPAPRALRVMYFRPGLRWIPTYRVSLPAADAPARRAGIRLQAEILNEAEDLADVPLDIVVGVPNFRFRDSVSPFVMEQTLKDALRAAAPQLMAQNGAGGNANFFRNDFRGDPGTADAAGGASIEFPAEVTGTQGQDLFTYALPRITLKRGERAAVPVFDAEVPLRDVYTWDLQVGRTDNEAAPAGAGTSPLRLTESRIWHQVELVNATGVPWTTGAAFLVQGERPVAQELLGYTSPGNTVRVPVTVAIDLRGTFAEEETKRDLAALRFRNADYARIDKLGRVSVRSFRREAADVEVTCSLGGRVDSATMGGEVTLGSFRDLDWKDYGGHPAVNNHSDVRFRLRLEPGATLAPEFAYHYFTSR